MKCKIPEISWHNRDPVLSVDIQPNVERVLGSSNTAVQRLASGGTDAHVLIWYMHFNAETSDLDLELAADLSRHQRAVNVVKWSPNGELLASGDDESVIFIWKQKSDSETLNILENTNDEDKEIWLIMKILRGHVEDVYDLSWSPDSLYLASGSVDNTAMLWNINKGKSTAILSDHKGFVQGVAWDPLNQYIATLSTDRHLRIFDIQTRKIVQRIHKCKLPVPASHELFDRELRIYHDDTLQTFFRRLTFTPDGKLLITPAGLAEHESLTQSLHTSYVYSRYCLKQPAIVLPSPDQYTVAVRCCPVLFKLRPHAPTNLPVVPLPYRMIFAVATRCSLVFYDTQQSAPFAVISNIHYTRLTDITWSNDGRIVVVSSTDGFCSLITFDAGELGEEYEQSAAMLLSKEQANINNQKSKKSQKNQINKSNSSKFTQQSPKSAKQNSMQNLEMPEDNEIVPDEKSPVASDIEEDKAELNVAHATKITKELFMPKIQLEAKKFVTPEKKVRIATPIEVRRQPRTPKLELEAKKVVTPAKKVRIATPIEVRRHPRTLNEVTNEKLAITVKDKDDAIKAEPTKLENKIPDMQKSKEKLEFAEKINVEPDQSLTEDKIQSEPTVLKNQVLVVEKLQDEKFKTNEKMSVEANQALNKTNMEQSVSDCLKIEEVKSVLEEDKMETDEEASKIKDKTTDKEEEQCEQNLNEVENSNELNDAENNRKEKEVKERIVVTADEEETRKKEESTEEQQIIFVKENSNQLKESEKNEEEKQAAGGKESRIEESGEEQINVIKETPYTLNVIEKKEEEDKITITMVQKDNNSEKEAEKIIETNMDEERTSNESLERMDADEEVFEKEENEKKKDLAENPFKIDQGKIESMEGDTKIGTAEEAKLVQEQKEITDETKQNNENIQLVSPAANNQKQEDQDSNNTSLTAQQITKTLTPQQHYTPPSERTPRRVALRTISTPKSKKKILE